ncbi:hypothetical protein COT75_03520 [Candidatus Beckwithbacteria bacterium CG10_big_fil_rev_8_21_14_0_10_34_10]|uniref:Uncharacterized protein n=1 Tax=Candidatus Beckwithbacteria bacterium CG10_big_fil_rev_8_21_14_0_10_34_10 TaxID=1974495 RepID=A0A2H0W8S4_9BACT|nr:MAG: hypothetical protein COT75_03520 [Candidatus Beckwithbacteria bacterium CG10_big_fil_rev_8_21_14_0_10_34_10]
MEALIGSLSARGLSSEALALYIVHLNNVFSLMEEFGIKEEPEVLIVPEGLGFYGRPEGVALPVFPVQDEPVSNDGYRRNVITCASLLGVYPPGLFSKKRSLKTPDRR